MQIVRFLTVFAIAYFISVGLQAKSLTVYLIDQKNTKNAVGSLFLTGDSYELSFDEKLFGDFFLSMRPFRCMERERLICHQPYPYDLQRKLSTDNLKALEYDLIFISRQQGEYGIDPYNGRYYVLEQTDRGFKGTVYGVDLNVLASPPEDGVIYPIDQDVLDEMEPDSVEFPYILIE